MGELILCRQPIAAMPFYFDNVSLNVYSLEEICYYIKNNLYLIESDFMSEDLCVWIEHELKEKEIAAALRNVMRQNGTLAQYAGIILKSCDYYNDDVIRHILSVLREMQNKSPFECGKIRADRYMENRKYVKAVYEYRRLLAMEEECKDNPKLTGNILHNMGAAYAKMFLFEEAALYFQRAYKQNENRSSLAACMAALRFSKNTEAQKKCKEEYGISEEEYQAMTAQWNEAADSEAVLESEQKIDHYFDGQIKDMSSNRPLMEEIEKMTKEYKKSCRI